MKCLCGCGQEVAKEGNKYIQYHHGRCFSEETRAKIGEASRDRIVSQETREKMSEAQKRRFSIPEERAKISRAQKDRVFSKETGEKISKANMGHFTSEETRNKISESLKGEKFTSERIKNLSLSYKGHIPSPRSCFGKRSYHNSPYQDKICFRSSYEKAYAEFLDANNMDWLYEPCTFDLGDTTYLPDFYLIKDRKFVEIKGYMRKSAQNKINLFRGMYLEEKLDILFKKDLIKMEVLTKDAKPWSISQHMATEEE